MDFLFGFENRRQIKEYERIVLEIGKYSKDLKKITNEELKAKTSIFKERLEKGETLDDILPEAYAVAKEASRRYLGIEQYPVQLMGAIALHKGDVAEMKTGEGKTYTAPLAAYLNALVGKSVHIATSNDTLATRDRDLIAPMFEGLGLTVGVVKSERDEDFNKDIESRKKAYSCDITYGSSNAFAFDYLRDNTTKNFDNIVRGDKELGFIIIDEADQILVNDAVMPFILSGSIKPQNENILEQMLRIQDEKTRQEKNARLFSDANAFVKKIYKDKEHVKECRTEEELQLYLGGNKEETIKANRKYSVLFSKAANASLTERGWLQAFQYFNRDNIDKATISNSQLIIDSPNFEEGKDYNIEYGSVSLTLRGLEKATREIGEFKKINNAFYASADFGELSKAINNALNAYFVLENGKEYILSGEEVEKGVTKKKVLLVSNGRTAEGRVYSNGLQQAIELKEQSQNLSSDIKIEMTGESDELASISQKAFYSIYPKISGMTGTSAETIFEQVYGMNTSKIPKNSEYNVDIDEIDAIYRGRVDKDTILFETEKEKMTSVVNSVLESIKKGQPVLIATTSVNESNKLYEQFEKMGISCQKLNAEISDIEKENEIISRAGVRGSVTISTQMAGRGTDIKLGGELEDYIDTVKKEEIDRVLNRMIKIKGVTKEEDIRKLEIEVTSMVGTKLKDKVTKEAKNRLDKEKQSLKELGGLKVIGYSHFPTKRDDDQLRGRAARQDDPGVTEFYCSVKDLKQNLGVSNDRIKYLRKKGLDKGHPISGVEVEKEISYAQSNIEGLLTSSISNTQEADYYLSMMRKKVYSQRSRIISGENPKEHMEFIIESSVINLIDRNLPTYSVDVSPRKKINKTGLDINNFVIDAIETFGIDLSKQLEKGEFVTLGDLQKFISDTAIKNYQEIRNKNGNEVQDDIDRKTIIETLDSSWRDFNANLEYIKCQDNLNALAQNQNFDEILAMKKGFNKSTIDAKIEAVSKIMGKKTDKKRTNNIEEDILEIDDSLNDYYIEESKKATAANLNVRPAKIMTTLINGLKVVKDKIKYEFQLVTQEEYNQSKETVEQMDFNSKEEQNLTIENITSGIKK